MKIHLTPSDPPTMLLSAAVLIASELALGFAAVALIVWIGK